MKEHFTIKVEKSNIQEALLIINPTLGETLITSILMAGCMLLKTRKISAANPCPIPFTVP